MTAASAALCLLDFLDAYASWNCSVSARQFPRLLQAASGEGSGGDVWRGVQLGGRWASSGTSSHASTPIAAALGTGDRNDCAAAAAAGAHQQQHASHSSLYALTPLPQLVLSYYCEQQRGRWQQDSDGEGRPEELQAELASIKLALGPHSVSMLLQLARGLTHACAAERQSRQRPADEQATAARQQLLYSGCSSAATAPARGVMHAPTDRCHGLRIGVRAAMCHVLVNMEEPLLTRPAGPWLPHSHTQQQQQHRQQQQKPQQQQQRLLTKGLLALLLLDARADVAAAPAVAPSPAAAASGLPNDSTGRHRRHEGERTTRAHHGGGGWEASCSLAHIGLQDLAACAEQRDVLSGAPPVSPQQLSGSTAAASGPRASCSLAIYALITPQGLAGCPERPSLLLTLSLADPRFVLVRRFVNNVMYVVRLVDSELAAAALGAQLEEHIAAGAAGGVAAAAAPPAAAASGTTTDGSSGSGRSNPGGGNALLLLDCSNLQLLLPRSHACKAEGNHYAATAVATRKTSLQHQKQRCSAHGSFTPDDGSLGGSSGLCHENAWQQQQQGSTRQDPCTSQVYHTPDAQQAQHTRLLAHHREALLLRIAHATVAAPGDPSLLQAAQQQLTEMSLVGCQPAQQLPRWVQEPVAVQALLDGSRALLLRSADEQDDTSCAEHVSGNCAPAAAAAEEKQKQQQQQACSRDGVGASSAAAAAAAAVRKDTAAAAAAPVCDKGLGGAGRGCTQQSTDCTLQSETAAAAAASHTPRHMAAPVRHGVLLLADPQEWQSDVSEATSSTADGDEASGGATLSATTRRLARALLSKLAPRRRRLVVRTDGASVDNGFLPTVVAAPCSNAATTSATAAGTGRPWQPQQQQQQRRVIEQQLLCSPAHGNAAAARDGGVINNDNAVLHADEGSDDADGSGSSSEVPACLFDLQGVELLAGSLPRPVLPGGATPPPRCLDATSHLLRPAGLRMALLPQVFAPASSSSSSSSSRAGRPRPGPVLAMAAPDGLGMRLCGASYRVLLDALSTNLAWPHSSFDAASRKPPPTPAHATNFNPDVRFSPAPGRACALAVTLTAPSAQCTLLADERWWATRAQTAGQVNEDRATDTAAAAAATAAAAAAAAAAPAQPAGVVVPLLSASLQQAGLCVAMMAGSWDTHVGLWASDTEWMDLRMANEVNRSSNRAAEKQQQHQSHDTPRAATGRWTDARHPVQITRDGCCQSEDLPSFTLAQQLQPQHSNSAVLSRSGEAAAGGSSSPRLLWGADGPLRASSAAAAAWECLPGSGHQVCPRR
jgi:hypothetical protein